MRARCPTLLCFLPCIRAFMPSNLPIQIVNTDSNKVCCTAIPSPAGGGRNRFLNVSSTRLVINNNQASMLFRIPPRNFWKNKPLFIVCQDFRLRGNDGISCFQAAFGVSREWVYKRFRQPENHAFRLPETGAIIPYFNIFLITPMMLRLMALVTCLLIWLPTLSAKS